jgi:polyisoprenoid-binding protein YceI
MLTNSRRRLLAATAIVAVTGALGADPATAADAYSFDTMHTEVIFSYSHLGNSRAFGEFRSFDGEVVLDRDDPSQSRIDVTIDPAGIDTGVQAFDSHLMSADFFDVDTFPVITFVSTAVEPTGDATALVTGDLTIKDNTRPVVLDVTLNYIGKHQLADYIPDFAGMEVAGFSASTTLLRSEFGLGMMAPMVGDEVALIIETELLRPMDLVD